MTDGELVAALEIAFAGLIEADDVDIEVAQGAVQVSGEEWTLHVEGWPASPLGWLALDDEPEDATERRATREAAMGEAALAALALADRTLEGGLSAALRAPGDPLSTELADAIRDHEQ